MGLQWSKTVAASTLIGCAILACLVWQAKVGSIKAARSAFQALSAHVAESLGCTSAFDPALVSDMAIHRQ